MSEGSLTYQVANSSANLYPVYDVYIIQNQNTNFEVSSYIPIEDINLSDIGGPTYSGSVTFIGKYKV